MLGREFLNGSAKGIVCGKVRAKAAVVCFGASILMARQREYAASFGLKAAGGGSFVENFV